MTLDEAIQHCKEVATENRRCALEFARVNVYDTARNCQECAAEYEQLALWLTELKTRRIAAIKELERVKLPKTNADRIRQMTDEELANRFDEEICHMQTGCPHINCTECALNWLKQEVSEDAGTDD